jgi:hypothetical protein
VASLINPKATNKMSEEKHVDYNSPEWRRRQEEFKQAYANESVMQELQFLRDQLAAKEKDIERLIKSSKDVQKARNKFYDELTNERIKSENLLKDIENVEVNAEDIVRRLNDSLTKKDNDLAAERKKNEELTQIVKELIPLAQTLADTLRYDEEYSGDEIGAKEAQQIIDKAKNLLK